MAALHEGFRHEGRRISFGSFYSASVSWQELIDVVPLDAAAAAWASEKHGLQQTDE